MNDKKIWVIPIFVTLLITVLFAGCTTQNPYQTTTQTPQITITQPLNGATLTTGNVTVSVQVLNFNIVDMQGQSAVAGEGHIHYFMDVDPPTTAGEPAVTATGTYVHTIDTTYTWTGVPVGTHTFSVELVNNNHTPLEPPVTATVTVTVQSPPVEQTADAYLNASGFSFDVSTITVPAGATVNVHFNNNDGGISHNFAVYTTSAATDLIFRGSTISGVDSAVYTFTAPITPGTYFFRCDIHPTMMTGSFVVT
jgi:plastocyanin